MQSIGSAWFHDHQAMPIGVTVQELGPKKLLYNNVQALYIPPINLPQEPQSGVSQSGGWQQSTAPINTPNTTKLNFFMSEQYSWGEQATGSHCDAP